MPGSRFSPEFVVTRRRRRNGPSHRLTLLQAAAVDVVTQPGWQAHLRALKGQLKSRRDLLVDSLRGHAPAANVEHVPAGGLNLWARLPDGTDMERLIRDCEGGGVVIAGGPGLVPRRSLGSLPAAELRPSEPAAFPARPASRGRTWRETADSQQTVHWGRSYRGAPRRISDR